MVENVKLYDDFAEFFVNPELYSLEAVLNAAYTMTDKAYVILSGDPDSKITVTIKPKGKGDVNSLALEFGNELISSQVYTMESKKQQEISDALIKTALSSCEEDEKH